MTWAQAVALIVLMIAVGKFIDSFHPKATASKRIVEGIRSALVWLFVKLEEIRPVCVQPTGDALWLFFSVEQPARACVQNNWRAVLI